jgi:hypothetical protein
MGRFSSFLRNPFTFLGEGQTRLDRVATYVIREHDRGRSLAEILDDPYIKNRLSSEEASRLLERPDIVRAVGEDTAEALRAAEALRR